MIDRVEVYKDITIMKMRKGSDFVKVGQIVGLLINR